MKLFSLSCQHQVASGSLQNFTKWKKFLLQSYYVLNISLLHTSLWAKLKLKLETNDIYCFLFFCRFTAKRPCRLRRSWDSCGFPSWMTFGSTSEAFPPTPSWVWVPSRPSPPTGLPPVQKPSNHPVILDCSQWSYQWVISFFFLQLNSLDLGFGFTVIFVSGISEVWSLLQWRWAKSTEQLTSFTGNVNGFSPQTQSQLALVSVLGVTSHDFITSCYIKSTKMFFTQSLLVLLMNGASLNVVLLFQGAQCCHL